MSAAGPNSNAIPRLDIPVAAIARHPETITKPRELKAWLAQLPSADPQHLADSLLRQLQLLVRDPETEPRYADLLDLYHPSLQTLQATVWDQLTLAHGQTKNSRRLQSSVLQLVLEIAYAHMRLINGYISAGDPPAATQVYHAILPLCRLLHWDLLQYNLIRPSIWRQTLQVFAIGQLYRVNDGRQPSQLSLEKDATTSHGVFFSTLVLLLCDPYRLPRQNITRLIASLGDLAEHLSISSSSEAGYRIALDQGARVPPLRRARQELAPRPGTRYLQLDDFLEQLKHRGLPGDNGVLAGWLSASLCGLADKAQGREARRHPRQKREADYHFVHGMQGVHKRLSALRSGEARHTGPDPGSEIVLGGQPLSTVEPGTPCRQIDQSRSGASFMLSEKTALPPVGCWVLFEADTRDRGRGFVAQVRRCLNLDTRGHEIGVEKLPGRVIPVTFGLEKQVGLLCLDREEKQLQLIAPGGSFRESGQRLTLQASGRQYPVVLEALQERNAGERIRVSLA